MEPNSPAALAGLRPHSDYIIGADTVMNEVISVCINNENYVTIFLLTFEFRSVFAHLHLELKFRSLPVTTA